MFRLSVHIVRWIASIVNLEGQHKEECVEYPLACPNKCGCIPRKDVNEHRSICPLEVINCEYQTMHRY